jgi:hypothetical protein
MRPDEALLQRIKSRLPELEELYKRHVTDRRAEEEAVYRYYHRSFKVYAIQDHTEAILGGFEELGAHLQIEGSGFVEVNLELNSDFLNIVRAGTGIVFERSHNLGWPAHTLPQLQAYWHAKYMLVMMIKYAKQLEVPPDVVPYGWASVLRLYNLR